ncbi:MAG: Na+/H+ antiporter NhaA [Armatimonadetes bacterium]|nr:Na+/H+ antiporter NhaA [Armatimonadota bacterium]
MDKQNTPSKLQEALRPFQEFFRQEATGGVVLIAATLAAIVAANSGMAGPYEQFRQASLALRLGGFAESNSVLGWVNDGLMAIFFLVVGLEVKRELVQGELSTARQAALPVVAAIGGMIVPALLYLSVNAGGDKAHGWGVPMATDIAFALGVLALLGNRVPHGLKVFLAALAIIDDIGAVLVIALFYSGPIKFEYALAGVGCLALLGILNLARVKALTPYLLGGLVAWWAVHHSGLHATLAGVATAFLVPAKALRGGESPLERLLRLVHPWVVYLIVPLFAFVNAGLPLNMGELPRLLRDPLPLGVLLGLVLGKPIGIVGGALLALKTGWAALPEHVRTRHLVAAGALGGIGFTMAIFIAGLAFPDPSQLEAAKLGVLSASLVSAVLGFLTIRLKLRRPDKHEA